MVDEQEEETQDTDIENAAVQEDGWLLGRNIWNIVADASNDKQADSGITRFTISYLHPFV